MLESLKKQSRLPREVQKVLKDLKRVYGVEEFTIDVNSSYKSNKIVFYPVAVEFEDITIHVEEREGLPSGYYYAMYNECNKTTYLLNKFTEVLTRISKFAFYSDPDCLKYCSDFDSFRRYVNNDCIK